MTRSRRLRAPFVITIASVAATLAACGGSTSSDSQASGGSGASSGSGGASTGGGGSGNVSGSGGNPGCPATFPSGDTSCSLPNGTTCNYDQGPCCPDWQTSCLGGKWAAMASSCNPPPPAPCPESPPSDGVACGSSDPCAGSNSYCTYGMCIDGSPATITECNGGTWKLSYSNCTMPACEGLSACECFDRSDCQAVSDSCICDCDYNCPGKPPCDCICGGGTYLGCKPLAA